MAWRAKLFLFFSSVLALVARPNATLPSPQHLVTTVLAPEAVEVGATAKAAIVSLVFLSVARKSFRGSRLQAHSRPRVSMSR